MEGESIGEASGDGDIAVMSTPTPVASPMAAVPVMSSVAVTPALPEVPIPAAPVMPRTPQVEAIAAQPEAAAIAETYAAPMITPMTASAPAPAPVMASPPASVFAPAPLQFGWTGDLTQVETNVAKMQAAQARAGAVAEPPHARRVRPALPPVSDEPLMQVETRRNEAPAQL